MSSPDGDKPTPPPEKPEEKVLCEGPDPLFEILPEIDRLIWVGVERGVQRKKIAEKLNLREDVVCRKVKELENWFEHGDRLLQELRGDLPALDKFLKGKLCELCGEKARGICPCPLPRPLFRAVDSETPEPTKAEKIARRRATFRRWIEGNGRSSFDDDQPSQPKGRCDPACAASCRCRVRRPFECPKFKKIETKAPPPASKAPGE